MKKILYFEDDQALADMYKMSLEKEGLEVKHYLNPPEKGENLISLVLEEKPDIIISDIIHYKMDGFEMIKVLKSSESTKNIPFFFHTNMNQKEEIKKAEDLGVTDYFVNSLSTPAEFADCIKKFFNNQPAYAPQYKKYL